MTLYKSSGNHYLSNRVNRIYSRTCYVGYATKPYLQDHPSPYEHVDPRTECDTLLGLEETECKLPVSIVLSLTNCPIFAGCICTLAIATAMLH